LIGETWSSIVMVENGKILFAEGDKMQSQTIEMNYLKLDENSGYAPYFREVLR
jgi:penicillin-binding protein 1A